MQKVIDAITQGERDDKKLALLVHERTGNKHGNKVEESEWANKKP
jgi:hypothetical protein